MTDDPSSRIRRTALLIWFCASTSACTSISITSPDGGVVVDRRFGFASVSVAPDEQPILIETRALGVLKAPAGFSAGYVTENLAVLPKDDCRLIIWMDSETSTYMWEESLANIDEICQIERN